jgi:hypothetical protein
MGGFEDYKQSPVSNLKLAGFLSHKIPEETRHGVQASMADAIA